MSLSCRNGSGTLRGIATSLRLIPASSGFTSGCDLLRRSWIQEPRERLYTTHKNESETTIKYKYHPYAQKGVWVNMLFHRYGRAFAKIESPAAPEYMTPVVEAWLIDSEACSRLSFQQEPMIELDALQALRTLLDAQPFLYDAVSSIPPSDRQSSQGRIDAIQAETTQARACRRAHLGATEGGVEEQDGVAVESTDLGAMGRDAGRLKR